MMAYSILKEFREGTNISKAETSITIGELKYNKPEIKRLYSILRNQPYVPKRKTLDLPFQIRKNAKMEAFGKRMHQIGCQLPPIKIMFIKEIPCICKTSSTVLSKKVSIAGCSQFRGVQDIM